MDILNCIMGSDNNWIMDIHNWIMDIHNYNWIMDILD